MIYPDRDNLFRKPSEQGNSYLSLMWKKRMVIPNEGKDGVDERTQHRNHLEGGSGRREKKKR